MEHSEFSLYFWQYINENAISITDRNIDNKDFYDAVCFDCYRIYMQSNMDINVICKLAENIFFNINRYKPILKN